MKDKLLYPLRRLRYYWGTLAGMIICGIVLDMPGFIVGVAIGAVILYLGMLMYRMIR